MFFVNYPLRLLLQDPDGLDRFLARGLAPELGLDAALMGSVDARWHERVAETLDRDGTPRGLHLPFFDLQPGGVDPLIREASRRRLQLALEIARIYRPQYMVAHAAYDRFLYIKSYDAWLERSVDTWQGLLQSWPEHPPLRLEHVFETDPLTVSRLAEALRNALGATGANNVGLCLDVGHWHSFGQGARRNNLAEWLDAFAPYLGHLHLHDNDGSFDQHKGPGFGGIPFALLFEELDRRGLSPTMTFEPHSEEDLLQALAFADRHPERFSGSFAQMGEAP